MRVLEQFDYHKHSAALNQGKTQLWAGTHNQVPTPTWQVKYLRYRHRERFMVTAMEGSPHELAGKLPRDAICVLEGGETKCFPITMRSGCVTVRTSKGFLNALDERGEVWPAEAIRCIMLDQLN